MSLSAAHFADYRQSRVAAAIEFLTDPTAEARRYNAEHPVAGYDSTYPYALGVAQSIIGSLLDALGACDHGPDRFDCEWALTHPWTAADYEDDEVTA